MLSHRHTVLGQCPFLSYNLTKNQELGWVQNRVDSVEPLSHEDILYFANHSLRLHVQCSSDAFSEFSNKF